MNLPPFPSLPSSPQERLRLLAYGEICARMERERCAMIADRTADSVADRGNAGFPHIARSIAAAIRGEAERKDER